MKLFINDIPIYLLSQHKVDMMRSYGLVIKESENILPDMLVDDVLIMNASYRQIDSLLKLMTTKKLKKVHSIFISSREKKQLVSYLKTKFIVIKAAGGVVVKDDKFLMIYRKKKWDLPKGKKEKKEKIRDCALREVEEETGVEVAIEKKIQAVWHTYTSHKKYILKKTNWYLMSCLNDDNMLPQKEEGIQEVKWMTLDETIKALKTSYRSIRCVMQELTKDHI